MAQEMVISKELSYLAELSVGMFEDANYSANPVPNTISIRQNRFWLVSSEGRTQTPNPLKLHFVTLGAKAPEGRTYYEGAYDPENSSMPDCFSYDGVTPDARGPKRQAEACGSCKQSMWGSATSKLTGAMVPACRTHKDIVIKVMGVEGAWLLRIPPASIKKQWAPLVKRIEDVAKVEQAKHGKSTMTMLTTVVESVFDDDAQGVLNFRPLGYLSQSEAPAVIALAEDRDAIAQSLWGPEGATRAAQWANPRNEPVAQSAIVQPLPINPEPPPGHISQPFFEAKAADEGKRLANMRRSQAKDIDATAQSVMEAKAAAEEKRSADMRRSPKKAIIQTPPENTTPSTSATDDEVEDILKSMGVFDG